MFVVPFKIQIKLTLKIRLGIFVGFATFFFMEKTLRVLGGEDESHGHGHSHSHAVIPETAHTSGVDVSVSQNGLRSRNPGSSENTQESATQNATTGPSKMSAYLNLFGDFVHNM